MLSHSMRGTWELYKLSNFTQGHLSHLRLGREAVLGMMRVLY